MCERLAKNIDSPQFEQVQLRENEVKELQHLMEEIIPCEVKVCSLCCIVLFLHAYL